MTGFCGGLDEQLAVGALILADGVTARRALETEPAHAEVLPTDRAARQAAEGALRRAGLAFHTGLLVTVAQPALRAEDKARLGQATRASGVDMESAAVARVAGEKKTAFLVLRAVSDAVHDQLPAEVAGFLDESGRPRATQVLKYAAGGPAHLKELWRLKSRSDQAAGALTAAWKVLLPALLAAGPNA
jgi:nucleoside phosphorylase